jgi:hypothetical protein
MKHGHPQGAEPEEIPAFADALFKKGPPLAHIVESNHGSLRFKSKRPIVKAELNYTMDRGKWQERMWQTAPAQLDAKAQKVTAKLPPEATSWYINLFDDRGLVVSSEHEYRDAAAASPAL